MGSSGPSGSLDLAPGDTLGAYRLEAVLGQGAMGVVYRATRAPDEATVALKVLKPALSTSDVYTRRFLREARAATEVAHESLVPIVDAGETEGRHYLAMRFVEGHSLEERLHGAGPLALDVVLRLAAELGAGLDALHRVGLVHRDVKPSNIMLDAAGRASLTDFGLAKGPAYTVLTQPGQLLGTLDYLAPELIEGAGARPASDIYALGCVVYACIAGTPPFASENIFRITVAHLEQEPPDPCRGRGDLPAGLSRAVLAALAKHPDDRPPTARAYALTLLRAASG